MTNPIKRGTIMHPGERKKVLLSLLYEKIDELGRTPTKKEWDEDTRLPSFIPVKTCFGSWVNFLKQAGVDTITQIKKKVKEQERKTPKGIEIIRVAELDKGDLFLYHQKWRVVLKKDKTNIHYQTYPRLGGHSKETVGIKSQQYVQVERAIKQDAEH